MPQGSFGGDNSLKPSSNFDRPNENIIIKPSSMNDMPNEEAPF
jgi:hypothetical protein